MLVSDLLRSFTPSLPEPQGCPTLPSRSEVSELREKAVCAITHVSCTNNLNHEDAKDAALTQLAGSKGNQRAE